MLAGTHVLITGGTGSYGRRLLDRLLRLERSPETVTVFSRDEEKQYRLRHDYPTPRLRFHLGDIRDPDAISSALRGKDVVFNAAALKQVPACEYAPREAILTNLIGADNLVGSIERHNFPIQTVIGISTDKACKPVNVMGMTKALQERVFIQANLRAPRTRFVCVRYGNVLASRGSVIPLFLRQARARQPLTVTDPKMTRFLLTLDEAVDTSLQALRSGRPGEVVVPKAEAAFVGDIAAVIGKRGGVDVQTVGVRPGEKHHEIMVSEEEVPRARRLDRWFHIQPMLEGLTDQGELHGEPSGLTGEYSSGLETLSIEALERRLDAAGLLPDVPQARRADEV
jgi:FlaA1/EpsC-like NDP-sugar epimerase